MAFFSNLIASFLVDADQPDKADFRAWGAEVEAAIEEWFARKRLFKFQASDEAGGNVDTAQPWFPTAGGVLVSAGQSYAFKGQLRLSRAAGTVSHTTGVLFGGTATLTQISYLARCKEGDANTLADLSAIWAAAATELVVKAASTSTTEQIIIEVEGIVVINAAGTLIPQFQYSAAPGGAPSVLTGSNFFLKPLGAATEYGTWA
jgi:hypothetical protein